MTTFEPVPAEEMEGRHSLYTFCEVQREIYRIAKQISDGHIRNEIQTKTRLAVAMAKPMAERIKALDPEWPAKYYSKIEAN